MADKQKIINDIYFDRAGFGSKANTLKDAREKDKSITMADVEKFFRENVEVKGNQEALTVLQHQATIILTKWTDFLWVSMILMMNKHIAVGLQ